VPQTAQGSWNDDLPPLPATTDLSDLLALPGCPICHAAAVGAITALAATTAQNDLCKDHAWLLYHEIAAGRFPASRRH